MKSWIQKLKLRLPAIFLLLGTVLFWSQYDRYEVTGPPLLNSPSLADASRVRGDASEETNGHFVLNVPSGGKTASLSIRMPNAADHLMVRVSGRIKVTDVKKGKHPWSCSRILLLQYDAKNRGISADHQVVSERGTTDWMWQEEVFYIAPKAKNVDVIIQQNGRSGTAEFDQLKVDPVKFRSTFLGWRIIFAGLWIGMAVLFYRRSRLDCRKLRILILLNVLAILMGALMPGEWISDTTDRLKKVMEKTVEKSKKAPSPGSKKSPKENPPKEKIRESHQIDSFNDLVGSTHQVGHFLLFASLCLLVYCSAALEDQHPIYFIKVAFDLLLFSVITEALQYLTMDRTPGFSDWLTDVYGMISAFFVFLMVLVLRRLFLIFRRKKSGFRP